MPLHSFLTSYCQPYQRFLLLSTLVEASFLCYTSFYNLRKKGLSMKQNGMATAALIMGLIAIISTFSSGMGFIFGALGITFALLSRREYTMDKMAHAGLILSIIGTIASIITLVFSIIMIYKNPDIIDQTMEQFYSMYGYENTDDLFEDPENTYGFGFDFGDTSNEGGFKL